MTPVAEKEEFEAPSKERIKARLSAMDTVVEGELTLLELLFIIAHIKVMVICESKFNRRSYFVSQYR